MSQLLEAAAREDKQRREDLDREDGRMFSEQQFLLADIARNENKGQRLAAVNDAHAMDLQIQFQGCIGELPQ